MSNKTMKQFVDEGKPDSAIFAISLEDLFAWAMVTSDGEVCSYSSADMSFSSFQSFAAQIMQLKKELAAIPKLVEEIDGIVLRLPKLKDKNSEMAVRRLICVGIVKAFFGMHDIPVLPVEESDIPKEAVKEAQKIGAGVSAGAAGQEEIYALEALITKTTPPEEEKEDDLDLNGRIKLRKAGAA